MGMVAGGPNILVEGGWLNFRSYRDKVMEKHMEAHHVFYIALRVMTIQTSSR